MPGFVLLPCRYAPRHQARAGSAMITIEYLLAKHAVSAGRSQCSRPGVEDRPELAGCAESRQAGRRRADTGDARAELAAVHPVTSRLLAENGQRQHRSRGDSDAGGRCRHDALRVFLAGTARLGRSGLPGETATGVRPSGRRGTRPCADPGLQGWSTSWAPCRDPTSFRRSAHGT